jgi:hypothetical protein
MVASSVNAPSPSAAPRPRLAGPGSRITVTSAPGVKPLAVTVTVSPGAGVVQPTAMPLSAGG